MIAFKDYCFGPYYIMSEQHLRRNCEDENFWEIAAGSREQNGSIVRTGSNSVRWGHLGIGPFEVDGVGGDAGKSTSLLRGVLQLMVRQKLLILKGAKKYTASNKKQKNHQVDVVRQAHSLLRAITTGDSQLLHGIDTCFVAVDLQKQAHIVGNNIYAQTLLNSPEDMKRLQGMLGEDVRIQALEKSDAESIGPLMNDLLSRGWLSKKAAAQHKRQQGKR